MGAVTVTTEVARSAQEVFTYATDPTTFHEWQDGVRSGHMDRPGVPVPGAVCTTTRRIGFTDRTSHSVVTHVDPPARWGTRGDDGPIRAVVDVTVEASAPNALVSRSRWTSPVTASAPCWSRWRSGPQPARRCRATWPPEEAARVGSAMRSRRHGQGGSSCHESREAGPIAGSGASSSCASQGALSRMGGDAVPKRVRARPIALRIPLDH